MHLLLSLFFLVPPLNLNWEKEYKNKYIQLENYQYHSGNMQSNPLVYVGKSLFLNMESELQLFFFQKKIYKAILIFGPKGIDHENCIKKFRDHVALLTKKYGTPAFQKTETSFLESELIYASQCHLYSIGMKKRTVSWKTKKFNIKTFLVGDDEGFYIETFYLHRDAAKPNLRKNKKDIYKRISKEIRK